LCLPSRFLRIVHGFWEWSLTPQAILGASKSRQQTGAHERRKRVSPATDLRSIDLPSGLLRMPLGAFGSKRPGHPPRVKADHKHDVEWHAKDNVKHRHEQYGFLKYQCL
jgi:hypothetical protein